MLSKNCGKLQRQNFAIFKAVYSVNQQSTETRYQSLDFLLRVNGTVLRSSVDNTQQPRPQHQAN